MQQESLTNEQQIVLNDFKQHVKSLKFDDDYLIRFLKARNFDLQKTIQMWDNFIQWRKINDIDNIQKYEFSEIDKVRQFYPHGYFYHDKTGRPIYIERLGQIQVQELWKVTNEDRMIRYLSQAYEYLLKTIFPIMSQKLNKKISKNLVIFDLKGLSLSMVPQIKSFIQMATQLGQNNYPEILGALYIINAPMFFSGVWKVIKTFFDQNTQKKIQILGSGYKDILFKEVDLDKLPTFLGGQGECDLSKNLGPWNPNGLELYGNFNDIKEKNKSFSILEDELSQNNSQKIKLIDSVQSDQKIINKNQNKSDNGQIVSDYTNINNTQEQDDFVSINNQTIQHKQSADIFYSMSENLRINQDRKSQNTINDFETLKDNNIQSFQTFSKNNQNFISFAQNDSIINMQESQDYFNNQDKKQQIKIKINPNQSAIEIFKDHHIWQQEVKNNHLENLFLNDKIKLIPKDINQISKSQQQYIIYKKRYLILFSFLLLTFAVFLNNFTLYSVLYEYSIKYNCSLNQINLSNYLNLVMTALFYILLSIIQKIKHKHLNFGCLFTIVGLLIRCIEDIRFLFAGQILLGIGRPFILILQQNVVLNWFPPQERTFVYNIIAINCILGCVLSFILPNFVNIDQIFIIEGIIGTLMIIFGLIFYQNEPKILASIQSQKLNENDQEQCKIKQVFQNYIKKTSQLFSLNLSINILCYSLQFSALKCQMLLQFTNYDIKYSKLSINLVMILSMMFLSNFFLINFIWTKFNQILFLAFASVIIGFQSQFLDFQYLIFINIGLFIITPKILQQQLEIYEIRDKNYIISLFVFFSNILSVIFCLIFQQFTIEIIYWQLILSILVLLSGFLSIFIKINANKTEKINGFVIIDKQINEQFIHSI